MLDLCCSIIKHTLLYIILGTSAYAFNIGEHITAIYFALMYICLVINFKQGEE